MEGFLLLVALFAVALAWVWIKDKIFGSVNKGLNRTLFQRGAYKDSADLLGSEMRFRTAGTPSDIIDVLLSRAPLVPERPKINPDLYLLGRNENAAVICLGNFMEPEQIRIELAAWETETPGIAEGSFGIPQWIEFDGVAHGIRKTKELRRRLVETIMAADPNATVDGVHPGQYLAQHHA